MKNAVCILLLVLACPLLAQEPDAATVLATVGEEPITVGEFRARYTLGVFPYKDQPGMAPLVRVQFLYALIAERLLMAEARRRGVDQEDRFQRNHRMATEMFMRDRLYRDSIRGAVTVGEEDIRARFVEEQQSIQYDFLFSRDAAEIHNLHRLLRGGMDFDTLRAAQQQARERDAADNAMPEPPWEAPMDADFHTAIAALRPGAVSDPLEGVGGWYLVRKMDYGNPLRSEYELRKRWKRIESQLRAEKENAATMAFVQRCWKGRHAHFEEEPYRAIGTALLADFRRQAAADTATVLHPSVAVFDSLADTWARRWTQPFLRIRPGLGRDTVLTLSVGEALDRLQAADSRLSVEDLSRFPSFFRRQMRELADRFLVTSVAAQLGLEQHPDVRRDVAMWAASGLAAMLPELLWEQFIASDDSVWNYYVRRPDVFGPPVEVKIIEVLTHDSTRMREILARVRSGEDLRALARAYSERPGAAERDGALGFFPVSAYGPIGRAAFGLRIAERAGPLAVPEGTSFFQLLDKRYPGMKIGNMDELRDTVTAVAGGGRTRAIAENLVRDLAARGGITVDTDLLERIRPDGMQMFTIRALGFGGRIPAAPGVAPLHEAVMEGMGMRGGLAP
jgi:parvulin-like peptidyl-prolyl isomerase